MTLFQAILEKIKAYDTIIIHRHQRPDPDAIGSQIGLKEILKTNFSDKKILATGINEPTLSWIAEMDEVPDNDYEGALVIVTDTANTPRIDDDRYDKGDFLIKIDHHPNDDAYGDLLLVDTSASSASEIVTDWALTLGLSLSDAAARVLYNGIVGDTGRFLYPSTTPKTLQIAAKLREYDFDFASMARRMDSFPFKIAKLQGYVFDNLEVDENGAARVVLTRKVLDDFNITDAESSAIVGTPGRIDSVESWAIFVEQPEGHYRVRLRSKTIVINEIAKRHDGGGHPLGTLLPADALLPGGHMFAEVAVEGQRFAEIDEATAIVAQLAQDAEHLQEALLLLAAPLEFVVVGVHLHHVLVAEVDGDQGHRPVQPAHHRLLRFGIAGQQPVDADLLGTAAGSAALLLVTQAAEGGETQVPCATLQEMQRRFQPLGILGRQSHHRAFDLIKKHLENHLELGIADFLAQFTDAVPVQHEQPSAESSAQPNSKIMDDRLIPKIFRINGTFSHGGVDVAHVDSRSPRPDLCTATFAGGPACRQQPGAAPDARRAVDPRRLPRHRGLDPRRGHGDLP